MIQVHTAAEPRDWERPANLVIKLQYMGQLEAGVIDLAPLAETRSGRRWGLQTLHVRLTTAAAFALACSIIACSYATWLAALSDRMDWVCGWFPSETREAARARDCERMLPTPPRPSDFAYAGCQPCIVSSCGARTLSPSRESSRPRLDE